VRPVDDFGVESGSVDQWIVRPRHADVPRAIYWLAAAVLTAVVTF